MNRIPLREVASVRSAVIFREKAPKPTEDGNVRALTIKDIVGSWPIAVSKLQLIKIDASMQGNCLAGGEILIPSRGDRYPARYFQGNSEPIFPYGQINVITPKKQISGLFLAWYLNQVQAQRYLERSLTGTSIRALNRPALLEVPIAVPAIQIQLAIEEMQRTKEEGKRIKERLIALEEQEIEWTCRQLLLQPTSYALGK